MNQKLVLAALSALLLSTACTKSTGQNGALASGKCWGVNSCKGKGECSGGANNSCGEHNACKGLAWIQKPKGECEKAGGIFETF